LDQNISDILNCLLRMNNMQVVLIWVLSKYNLIRTRNVKKT